MWMTRSGATGLLAHPKHTCPSCIACPRCVSLLSLPPWLSAVPNCGVGWGVDAGVCSKCDDTSVSPGGLNAVCQACGPDLKPNSDSTSCVPGEGPMLLLSACHVVCLYLGPRRHHLTKPCTVEALPICLKGSLLAGPP
mgnify:CR=1 FL=1